MTTTLRFCVTVALTWALFISWVAIAYAASPGYAYGASRYAIVVLISMSCGAALGFLAAAMFCAAREGSYGPVALL